MFQLRNKTVEQIDQDVRETFSYLDEELWYVERVMLYVVAGTVISVGGFIHILVTSIL